MRTLNLLMIGMLSLSLFSCVSSGKFKALLGEKTELEQSLMNQTTRANEFQALSERIEGQLKQVREELAALTTEKANLEKQMQAIKSGASAEIESLLAELQRTRSDLAQREDKLRESEKELKERNARLMELQDALRMKEETVNALRQKVADALIGFQNNGLTVYEKNGKVYVSLEESLLFKSGQWVVDPKGQQALRDLAGVLAQNPDINVMVEGHTDDVPMRSANQVRENWDLSVMRATAVAKVMLQNQGVDPVRITAAGRSEYLPLDPEKTTEARQKNRRTEIILTPKLDELFRLIETN